MEECIITDATAGVGGDTLSFSSSFKYINAIEKCHNNYRLLNLNCSRIGVTNVMLYNIDCLHIIKNLKQDIIYFDPPWGGVGYKDKKNLRLYISGIPIDVVINEFLDSNVLIFFKLPFNAYLGNINIENKHIILNKKELPSFYLIQCSPKKDTESIGKTFQKIN